jgi:hypothetical protein
MYGSLQHALYQNFASPEQSFAEPEQKRAAGALGAMDGAIERRTEGLRPF